MKSWMISTHNNPLGTVRDLIQSIWQAYRPDSILLPINGNTSTPGPIIIDDPKLIQNFNPFTPIMPINAATLIPDLYDKGRKIAAVLRPCEMRTLSELINFEDKKIENLITICVDCLGTLPTDEFEWRSKTKGSPKRVSQEAINFIGRGKIVPYRYRAACQICKSPEATQADINISVLGLPVRKYLLIHTSDKHIENLVLQENALPADSSLLLEHQRVVSRLSERGLDTRQQIFNNLSDFLPKDIDSLVDLFRDCGSCQSCMENCPFCSTAMPYQDSSGVYIREDIITWLISCSDCGVCEQSCPNHLPLTIIFAHIRQQLEAL